MKPPVVGGSSVSTVSKCWFVYGSNLQSKVLFCLNEWWIKTTATCWYGELFPLSCSCCLAVVFLVQKGVKWDNTTVISGILFGHKLPHTPINQLFTSIQLPLRGSFNKMKKPNFTHCVVESHVIWVLSDSLIITSSDNINRQGTCNSDVNGHI